MAKRITRRKEAPATEYLAVGDIKLRNVTFVIKAESLAEAKKKAASGNFIEYDIDDAEAIDWDINPKTVEVNG